MKQVMKWVLAVGFGLGVLVCLWQISLNGRYTAVNLGKEVFLVVNTATGQVMVRETRPVDGTQGEWWQTHPISTWNAAWDVPTREAEKVWLAERAEAKRASDAKYNEPAAKAAREAMFAEQEKERRAKAAADEAARVAQKAAAQANIEAILKKYSMGNR